MPSPRNRFIPALPLFALVAAAAFPFRLRYGVAGMNSFTLFDLFIFAGGGLLALRLLRTGRLPIGDRKTFLLLLIVPAMQTLSLLWSRDPRATQVRIVASIEGVLAFLLVVALCRRVSLRVIMASQAAFLVLLLLGATLSMLRVPGFEAPVFGLEEGGAAYVQYLLSYYTRLSHPFIGLSNNFATVLAFFIFLFAACGAATIHSPRVRRFCGVLTVLAVAGVLLTQSRTAIGAIAAAAILFLWTGRDCVRLSPRAIAAGLIGMTLLGGGFWFLSETAQEHWAERLDARTVDERAEKLEIGKRKIAQSPVLGYGGSVAADNDEMLQGGVHNTYVEQILSFGIPLGALVSLALLALPLRLFFWAQYLKVTAAPKTARLLALGVAGSVTAELLIYSTQASFEGTLLRVLFYLQIAFGVSLVRAALTAATPATEGAGSPCAA